MSPFPVPAVELDPDDAAELAAVPADPALVTLLPEADGDEPSVFA